MCKFVVCAFPCHSILMMCCCVPRQALIYPLTVASKSTVSARQAAANKILKSMCERNATLVQQAMLVSHREVIVSSELLDLIAIFP